MVSNSRHHPPSLLQNDVARLNTRVLETSVTSYFLERLAVDTIQVTISSTGNTFIVEVEVYADMCECLDIRPYILHKVTQTSFRF